MKFSNAEISVIRGLIFIYLCLRPPPPPPLIMDLSMPLMKCTLDLCLCLCLCYQGGIYAGSLAIMTDAAHMFSDFGTFCISMLALYIAKKQANKKRTFGLYRAGMYMIMLFCVRNL